MEQEDNPYLCPSLGQVKQRNRKSNTIFEELKGEHQHWLIWWPENHSFSGCTFYKYSQLWDKRRNDPATHSDCGPLFINYKVTNYEFTTTIFQNRSGRKILNWSRPHPDYHKTDGFYGVAAYNNI